jgi:hypothetical protein
MPTRFCLKNIGDPSSMHMVNATNKKTGSNKKNNNIEITLFIDFKTF